MPSLLASLVLSLLLVAVILGVAYALLWALDRLAPEEHAPETPASGAWGQPTTTAPEDPSGPEHAR